MFFLLAGSAAGFAGSAGPTGPLPPTAPRRACSPAAVFAGPQPSSAAVREESVASGPDVAPTDASDDLMAVVSGDSYNTMLALVVAFGLHACVPFGSLNGVLNDAAWGASLHLTPEQVVTGDSAVFLAWIPGGLLGGGLCDAVGRKRASLGCAVLIALALVGTALVLPGDGGALIASRALAGLGIGGFMASAPTMLVESVDAGAKGRATLAWSVGYVAALALLAAVHLGLAAG